MKCFEVTLFIALQAWMFAKCEKYENEVDLPLVDKSNFKLPEGFVDPYSFHYDRPTNNIINNLDEKECRSKAESDSHCHYQLQQCKEGILSGKPDEIYTRRFINLLLSNAALKEDGNIMKGSVSLHATSEQMEILRKFGDGKISVRQVDSILSDIILPSQNNILMKAIDISELLLATAYQNERLISVISATLIVLWLISRARWTTGKVIIVILTIIFVMSFFITWWQLYKEAEIKLFVTAVKYSEIPSQCHPDKMSVWESLHSMFFGGKDQCEEYYKGLMMDPTLKVTPADVLSHLCTQFFLTPLPLAGHAIAEFVEGATGKLPFPLKWIVTILLVPCILLFVVFILACVSGGSLSFKLGPFFNFIIKGRESNERQPTIAEKREPIKVILQVTHEDTTKRIEPRISDKYVQRNRTIADDGDYQMEDEDERVIVGLQSEFDTREDSLRNVPLKVIEKEKIKNKKINKKTTEKEKEGSGDC